MLMFYFCVASIIYHYKCWIVNEHKSWAKIKKTFKMTYKCSNSLKKYKIKMNNLDLFNIETCNHL